MQNRERNRMIGRSEALFGVHIIEHTAVKSVNHTYCQTPANKQLMQLKYLQENRRAEATAGNSQCSCDCTNRNGVV